MGARRVLALRATLCLLARSAGTTTALEAYTSTNLALLARGRNGSVHVEHDTTAFTGIITGHDATAYTSATTAITTTGQNTTG